MVEPFLIAAILAIYFSFFNIYTLYNEILLSLRYLAIDLGPHQYRYVASRLSTSGLLTNDHILCVF